MSVLEGRGDIFQCRAEVIINPVNMKGVMGAGLAKQFRDTFPGIQEKYRHMLNKRWLDLGYPVLVEDPRWSHKVLLFATKDHWRDPSQLEWITDGLDSLIERCKDVKTYDGIAFPRLGCGLGKLKWEPQVKPEIIARADDLSYIFKELYLY